MKIARSIFFVLLFLSGCAGGIHERNDPFFEGTIRETSPIQLVDLHYDGRSGGYLSLVLQHLKGKDEISHYAIKVRAGTKRGEMIDVADGDSLLITADSQKWMYASAAGSAGSEPAPGTRHPESPFALYEISADDFRALAKARSVRVKVSGTTHTVSGSFSDSDRAALKEFVSTQVGTPIP